MKKKIKKKTAVEKIDKAIETIQKKIDKTIENTIKKAEEIL